MTDRCSYAGCATDAPYSADGWPFCLQHLGEHQLLQRDDVPAVSTRLTHDVDAIVVERAIQGRPPEGGLSRPERLCAVRILRRRGLSAGAIAATVGVHKRMVERDLAELRQEQAS